MHTTGDVGAVPGRFIPGKVSGDVRLEYYKPMREGLDIESPGGQTTFEFPPGEADIVVLRTDRPCHSRPRPGNLADSSCFGLLRHSGDLGRR